MHDSLPIALDTPCGADFSSMTATGIAERLCSACDKTVHDLSGRSDAEVERLLASGPVCVRYLYDATGARISAVPRFAKVVPASALFSKAARSRWVRAAAIAASAIVFEACGGNNGYRGGYPQPAASSNEDPADLRAPSPPASDAGDARSDGTNNARKP